MKITTYSVGSKTGVGLVMEDRTVDLTAAGIAPSVQALIEGGSALLERARAVAAEEEAPTVPTEAYFLAPIPIPKRNIFCIGKNYREHAKEFGQSGFDGGSKGGDEVPDAPIIFTKATTSVSANGDPILSSLDVDSSVDYEGELGVIIGKGGRGISIADAPSHIFGYTVINDVTARESQKRNKQWVLGKGVDTFCPMGPVIVTADAIDNVKDLRVVTTVNGEVRQNAPVSDLIFDIPTLIETISAVITLQPGDIIATGTPAGVGIGFSPPRYLQPGDVVEVQINPIGTLKNPIV
tara:strand:+ start:1118 stop:1999 length:882 start_codon:yes stop_codon:yes gene_type:complete